MDTSSQIQWWHCIAFGHFSSVTFKQLCLDPSFELLHSLSSNDPILTEAGNPLAQISSPWCEALPNETLLVKTVLLLLLLLCHLVCLWAPVKAAIRVHDYPDGRPKQWSACTIFLLCRSWRITCTRNRLSKQILKYSRKWSTSIFLRSLTFCKGPFRAFIIVLSLMVKLLNPRISFSKPPHEYMFVKHKHITNELSNGIC